MKHRLKRLIAAISLTVAALMGVPKRAYAANAAEGCDARDIHTSGVMLQRLIRLSNQTSVLNSSATDEYVRRLADPLRQAYGFPRGQPQIFVRISSDMDARAVPGNAILITTGLLDKARGSDVVQGYLAHEMGHVACRHSRDNAVWNAVSWGLNAGLLATEIGGVGWLGGLAGNAQAVAYLGGVGSVAETGQEEWAFVHAGWSRGQETKADLIGAEMLVHAHLRTDGLIFALRGLEGDGAAPGGSSSISAFSGSGHPEAMQRIENVRQYLQSVHPGFHDRPPSEGDREVWRQADANLLAAIPLIEGAWQTIGQPLALIGHPEYTNYPARNAAAVADIQRAFKAPTWQPGQNLPRTDPELADLAESTSVKMLQAELQLRIKPDTVDLDDLRLQIFKRNDVSEPLLLLDSLGYTMSGDLHDAVEVFLDTQRRTGGDRMDILWGEALASAENSGMLRNIFSLDCTLTADTVFMQQCVDVGKDPKTFLMARWEEARLLPQAEALADADVTAPARVRKCRRRRCSQSGSAVIPPAQSIVVPEATAQPNGQEYTGARQLTSDQLRSEWLKP